MRCWWAAPGRWRWAPAPTRFGFTRTRSTRQHTGAWRCEAGPMGCTMVLLRTRTVNWVCSENNKTISKCNAHHGQHGQTDTAAVGGGAGAVGPCVPPPLKNQMPQRHCYHH